jgi:hypothetical protein
MTGKYKTVELSFEKPIVVMRFTGKTSTEEMLQMLTEQRAMTEGWPYSFTLCDLTKQQETISAETRKAIADAPTNHVLGRGTAMFGATFAVRTIATLLMNVMNIASGASDNPTKFFDTEEQARAWLQERMKAAAA